MSQALHLHLTASNPGMLERLWWILRRTFVSTYEHNCFGVAKGAAYSALLSFFPVLTTMTAILVEANAGAVSKIISSLLFQVVPPGTEEIVYYNFTERGQRPIYLLILGTLLSLWAASGVVISLMQGFRAAYHIQSGRSFWHERAVSILLVFSAALPIVGSSALIVFGSRVERSAFTLIGLLPEGEQLRGWVSLASQIARYLAALSSIMLGTMLLYYFGPNRKQKVAYVWPGAIVAITLWWLATAGFGWYVRNIANYNVLYGSIGAVVALLVWMYLLSVIALIGCEFNAQREIVLARSSTLP